MNKQNQKNKQNKILKGRKGITLIALVITIIVLLILAGVTIAILTGENGILGRAGQASETTKDVSEDEQVKLAVADALINGTGTLSKDNLETALKSEFGEDKVTDTTFTGTGPWTFTGERNTYTIEKTGKITTGGSSSEDGQEADESTPYIGYYADLDGNAENGPEGIIYADLAVGKSDGQWNGDNSSKYSYDKKEGLKKYTVSEEEVTSEKFGNKPAKMITEKSGASGNDRFYVMALGDFDSGNAHTWYKSKSGSLSKVKAVQSSVNDFDKGKTNTEYWIEEWNKYENSSKEDNNDIWKIVQNDGKLSENYGKKWFVPSKSEWAAFGDMVWTKFAGDYLNLGLKDYYWSSSLCDAYNAYTQSLKYGHIGITQISNGSSGTIRVYIRLSATF